MSDLPDQQPSDIHEQFLRECQEIDAAFLKGTLHDWITEKLESEKCKLPNAGEVVG